MNNLILIDPPLKELNEIYDNVLTSGAVEFLYDLWLFTKDSVNELYLQREKRKCTLNDGKTLPNFREKSKYHLDEDWKVDELPERLQDRRLDLGDVSPSDGRRFAKAINQPVQGIQVDFDDGHCPNWPNQLIGIWNVILAVNEKLPGVNKPLNEMPLLVLRPRAWNIIEHHVMIQGQEIPGPIFDIALLLYHCGKKLADLQIGPCLYLSKLEGAEEAKLWNNIFIWIQNRLNIPLGTIKACVLIENILSSFEMDEILWELRMHSMGLNCGIWDYAASIIAKFGSRSDFILPDRNKYVNMDRHFMKSYMRLLIDTCHRRGAYATGGMAAQIIDSPKRKIQVVNNVVKAKQKEILAGVDGFMVYSMELIPYINKLWSEMLPFGKQNQLNVIFNSPISRNDLLEMPQGGVSKMGLKHNICVAILFIYNWSEGRGHFIYKGSVEDSATAEISRSQIWQWIRHQAVLEESGIKVTRDLVEKKAWKFVNHFEPENEFDTSFKNGDPMESMKIVNQNQITQEGKNKKHMKNMLKAFHVFMEMISMRNPPEFITTYLNDCFINRENLHIDFKLEKTNAIFKSKL